MARRRNGLMVRLLQRQQPALEIEAAAVPAQPASRCDDTVAGDDDGDGVLMVGRSHGPVALGIAHGPGDLRIRPRFTIRDLLQGVPTAALEWRARRSNRKRESGTLSVEI